MNISIEDISTETVSDIPKPCRTCLYWETPERCTKRKTQSAADDTRSKTDKTSWFVKILKEFGNCGKILYVDDTPVGYTQYSTPDRFPNITEYYSQKLQMTEDGTIFISCLFISEKNLRGKGLGEKLLEEVITDLRNRRLKAVETFARTGSANNPSGPLGLYLKKGFQVKEEVDAEFVLVRLDL